MVRIYISSTYNDLKDYRKVVYCALRQLGHDVIAMEDYVATDERPLDKCLDDVASCEVYVGIFAWRYGYIPEKNNPDKQSITEREFRHAMAENRSRLLFLVNENYPWSPMLIEKGDGASRLEALKAELRTDYTVSFFTTPDNLAQLVNSAVSLWEKKQDGQRKIGGTLTIPNYDFPTNYLPRKILSARQYSSVQRFLQQELSEDLVAVTKKERCVALLGNPGIGKTTELQRLAAVVIREDPRLYPHLIPLNKYVNQSFEQLLPVGWDKIPEDRYLLILDGFDEIESKNKNDAIRHIEFFLEQHPKARALISCRTNFYRTATQRFPGTLSGFVAYLLLDLDHAAVQNYIEDRLANRTWAFYEAITRSQTHELLRIPFFLVRLVDLFETRHSLPPSRAEIFEQMITERMKGDFVHYRTTFDLTERQKDILAILERIALGTEILGRNYLSDDEYRSLVPEGLRDLGAYCSLLVKEFGHESVTWRFEHNNFQEYFAARVLSRQSLETIKRFVSFETGSMRVIPSWVNTLSFLVNISSDPRLHRWILDEIPDLAVKFEPDRIDPATRERLFKAIFLGYKTKQIPIDRDKFNYLELARFGQSAQTVDFLLEEATAATHHAILQCAIELLGLMDVSHEAIARVRDFLIVVAIDNHRGPVVQNAALCALGNLGVASQDEVGRIVMSLRNSDNDWIRYGLYYFLSTSKYLDEHIAVFLEGIRFLRPSRSPRGESSRLGNERWHLKDGLEHTKSPAALQEILRHFTRHPEDLQSTYLNDILGKLTTNAVRAHPNDTTLFDSVLEILKAFIHQHYDAEATQLVSFFQDTQTTSRAFRHLFQSGRTFEILTALAMLANDQNVKGIIDAYERHEWADDDIRVFQNLLRTKNSDLCRNFSDELNRRTHGKFSLLPERDYDAEGKRRRQRDLTLLFDRDIFLNEVKRIFESESRVEMSRKELSQLRHRHWDDPQFSPLVLDTLLRLQEEDLLSVAVTEQIAKWDWDYFCVIKVYELMDHGSEIILSAAQRDKIVAWCNTQVKTVDFRNALAISLDGRQTSASKTAIYVWHFGRKFKIGYPREVLLDMLEFDWIENSQMLGLKCLEEQLDKREMTARILENLQRGIRSGDVLRNHFDYCKRHKIEGAVQFALREIVDAKRGEAERRMALDLVCELGTESQLAGLLEKVSDNFRWEIVEVLVVRENPRCHTFLLNTLRESGEAEDRLKAAGYLMRLQDLEGVRYYTDWIKQNKKFEGDDLHHSPLGYVRNVEALSLLLDLLKASYEEGIGQSGFYRLDHVILGALTEIALQNEENYKRVSAGVQKFIETFLGVIKNVNRLYAFLDSLEQKHDVNRSKEIDIQGAIKKLQEIVW